jgi:hypothetical protein
MRFLLYDQEIITPHQSKSNAANIRSSKGRMRGSKGGEIGDSEIVISPSPTDSGKLKNEGDHLRNNCQRDRPDRPRFRDPQKYMKR